MKVTALYTRVSTDMQEKYGLSLDAQLEALQAWADVHAQGTLVLPFREAESAGTIEDRPVFSHLVEMVRGGQVAALVITKLDRAFRNLDEARLVARAVLAPNGCRLVSLAEGEVEVETAAGLLSFTLHGAVAEFLRGRISENTRAALALKRARGLFHGMVPLGFRKVGGALVPDPRTMAVVRRIHAASASGTSVRAIAVELTRDRVPTPRGGTHWTGSTVHAILSNERYATK